MSSDYTGSRTDPAERQGPSCPHCRDSAERTRTDISDYDRGDLCPGCKDQHDDYHKEDAYDGSRSPEDRGSDPARRSMYDPRTR